MMSQMKTGIFCYSLKGKETASKIAEIIKNEYDADIECFSPGRMADEAFGPIPRPSGDFYGGHFRDKELFISVGSVGICVRHIAPYVKSKVTDPAVIVIDELGKHIIPVLSGHIGGANRIAALIADELGGEAVITTATDINGKFAVDEWAARNNMAISSMKTAKDFAAAILERELPLKSDFPVKGKLPGGMVPGEDGEIGLYITYTREQPFKETLRLIPKCLHLGIGCRKGISEEAVRQAVHQVAEEHAIDLRAVDSIASIDIKSEEEGLLAFAKDIGITPEFFAADELMAVEGDFTPSEFVKSVTGADNVCERSALIKGGTLIVRKTAVNGVTVAVAVKDMEVSFE